MPAQKPASSAAQKMVLAPSPIPSEGDAKSIYKNIHCIGVSNNSTDGYTIRGLEAHIGADHSFRRLRPQRFQGSASVDLRSGLSTFFEIGYTLTDEPAGLVEFPPVELPENIHNHAELLARHPQLFVDTLDGSYSLAGLNNAIWPAAIMFAAEDISPLEVRVTLDPNNPRDLINASLNDDRGN